MLKQRSAFMNRPGVIVTKRKVSLRSRLIPEKASTTAQPRSLGWPGWFRCLNSVLRSKLMYVAVGILLTGCDSLATDCLDMAPPGIWTKIKSPDEDIVKFFDSTAADSAVLWFKSGDAKFGLCRRCAAPSNYARSFQIGDPKLDKPGQPVRQECVR